MIRYQTSTDTPMLTLTRGSAAPGAGPRTGDGLAEAKRLAERGRDAAQRGSSNEAIGWFERALATLDGEQTSELTADVIRWMGTAHRDCGDFAAAERLYQRSESISRSAGYTLGVAHGANCRGIIAQQRGSLPEAVGLYEEAIRQALAAGDLRLVTMVQLNLGALASTRGDFAQARTRLTHTVDLAEQMRDDDTTSRALNNLALVHMRERKYDEAEQAYARVLELAVARGDALIEGACRLNRSRLFIAAGRAAEAEPECKQALEIADRRGDRARRAEGLAVYAAIRRSRGDVDGCAAALAEAATLVLPDDDALISIEVLKEHAELQRARGETASARSALNEALTRLIKMGAVHEAQEVVARLVALGPQ